MRVSFNHWWDYKTIQLLWHFAIELLISFVKVKICTPRIKKFYLQVDLYPQKVSHMQKSLAVFMLTLFTVKSQSRIPQSS